MSEILQRMLNKFPTYDTREGSLLYDLLAPVANELEIAYSNVENNMNYIFPDENTPSDVLEKRCLDYGITRKTDETDEMLLNRLREVQSTPSYSGNSVDYVRWAKQVTGIEYVRVIPIADGPGTVKVVVGTKERKAPTAQIVGAALTVINENRPILANVSVVPVVELSIDINVKLTSSYGVVDDNLKQQVESALNSYFSTFDFNDMTVRYSRIAQTIIGIKDVIDYDNLTINNKASNIALAQNQVAVLGKVNYL